MSQAPAQSLFIESFFLLLWIDETSDEQNRGNEPEPSEEHQKESAPENETVSINIPHTIIFKYGHPSIWYFNSKTGKILRKKEASMAYENIYKEFRKQKSDVNAAAVVYSIDENNKTLIQYLSWEEFKDICDNPGGDSKSRFINSKFCVLQQFVNDNSDFNCKFENSLQLLQNASGRALLWS